MSAGTNAALDCKSPGTSRALSTRRSFPPRTTLAWGGGELFQSLYGLFRPALLNHAHQGIDNHNGQDDNGVNKIPIPPDAGNHKGHPCRRQKHQHHKILELGQKTPEKPLGLFGGQPVGAIPGQALLCLASESPCLPSLCRRRRASSPVRLCHVMDFTKPFFSGLHYSKPMPILPPVCPGEWAGLFSSPSA